MKFEFITGPAGYGKSHLLRTRMEADPHYAVLTATTGIAAINLGEGVTTINSLLRFFDADSLQKAYDEGWLTKRLLKFARDRGAKYIVIDEVSMLPALYIDLIVGALLDAERESKQWLEYADVELPGLILTGDFCQLPPVKGQFAFHSKHWPKFAANTTRLSKNWRQSDPLFLEALTHARHGRGVECARALYKLGPVFSNDLDPQFDGTTLFPTNQSVGKYNQDRLDQIEEAAVPFKTIRLGKQKGEWVNEIPDRIELKKGALVLVLANEPETFRFVNGDSAEILDIVSTKPPDDLQERKAWAQTLRPELRLRLKRNGYEFTLRDVTRENCVYARDLRDIPDAQQDPDFPPYYDEKKRCWVTGEVRYMPVRLGYASTIHKAQGLSLDAVQIDIRNRWAAQPAMGYVALSRQRTPNGLRIVGNPALLASRITTSPEVKEWL